MGFINRIKSKYFVCLLICFFCGNNYSVYAKSYDKEELKQVIEEIYNSRSAALVSGDGTNLKQFFDVSQKYGQWALEHETKRVQYLKYWSAQRGIKFTNIESSVRVKKIYPKNYGVRMSLEESYKFDYVYPEDEDSTTNSFGVGIRHTVDLGETGFELVGGVAV